MRITGASPAFMRPPYGSYNQMVLDASGIRGQGVVIWDFESVLQYQFYFSNRVLSCLPKFSRFRWSQSRHLQGTL